MKVYHAIKPTWGHGPMPAWPDGYELVAVVRGCAAIDDAFRLTNHIDCAWWKNDGVELVGPPAHRSTSVGDVVVDAAGKVWRCEMVGWVEISKGLPR